MVRLSYEQREMIARAWTAAAWGAKPCEVEYSASGKEVRLVGPSNLFADRQKFIDDNWYANMRHVDGIISVFKEYGIDLVMPTPPRGP